MTTLSSWLNSRARLAFQRKLDVAKAKVRKLKKRASLIYNPKSGSAATPELWLGTIVYRLSKAGYRVDVSSTTVDTTAENILQDMTEPSDLIVAAGGDGTVRMVIDAVARQKLKIPVGIVPLGTGNLLARNLNIYEDNLLLDPLDKAIGVILHGKPLTIDLGLMNGHYFAAAAGVGPLSDAIIAPDKKDKETWKILAYAGSMVQTLSKAPVLFRINADGEEFKISATGIFVTNISDLGVGRLSDTASMHDGLLDLCILSPKEFSDYLKYGFHFAATKDSNLNLSSGEPPYYVRKVKSVKIEAVRRLRPFGFIESGINELRNRLTGHSEGGTKKEKRSGAIPAMIDGDECGTTPMQIEVAPQAVNVLSI